MRLAYFHPNRLLPGLYKQEKEILWRKDDGNIKKREPSLNSSQLPDAPNFSLPTTFNTGLIRRRVWFLHRLSTPPPALYAKSIRSKVGSLLELPLWRSSSVFWSNYFHMQKFLPNMGELRMLSASPRKIGYFNLAFQESRKKSLFLNKCRIKKYKIWYQN